MQLLKRERETKANIRRDYFTASTTVEQVSPIKQTALIIPEQVAQTQTPRRARKKRIATGVCILFALIGARYFWATHAPIAYAETPLPVVLKPAETTPNALYFYDQVAKRMEGKNPAWGLSGDERYDTLEICKESVDTNTETLKLLREGLKHKGMSLNHIKSGYWYNKTISAKEAFLFPEKSIPNFVTERTIARLFVAESQLKASMGDYIGAVNSNLDGLEFSTSIQTSDHYLDSMILILMQNVNLEAMQASIKHLTAKQAKDALERFSASEKKLPDIRRSVIGQEKAGMEIIQAMTPETMSNFSTTTLYDVYPNENMQAPAVPRWLHSTIVYGWTAGDLLWKGQMGMANDWHQHQTVAYQKLSIPYQQSRQIKVPAMHLPLLKSRLFKEFFDIDYSNVHFAHTRMQTRIQTIKAQLAIVAYRGEHNGVNPKSLSELVTMGYLEEVPLDLFSPNADAPLRYKNGKVWSAGKNSLNENSGGDDL
jgi:hypothetical protein